MLNLDTHIVIFALRDELLAGERALLEQEPWSISAIVLWELSKLVALGRIDLDLEPILKMCETRMSSEWGRWQRSD